MTKQRPKVISEAHYSVSEAAIHLDVDRKTIYRWRKCGYIREHKGRFNGRPYITGKEILKIYDIWSY